MGLVSFLPIVFCHALVGGVYDKIVPQRQLLISMWVFFFFLFAQSVGATQLVSKFLLEGIVPYVAIGSACLWEEMNSGAYV